MATLIKDVKEFKEVIGGVQQSIDWATIKGFVRTAEVQYIIPVLGDEFYAELVAYSGNDGNVLGLIERLKIASGYYALAIAIPQMVTSFGDGGMAVNSQGGGQAIAKWMNVQLIDSSLSQADKALENAIQYLEAYEKKQVNDAYVFLTWRESDSYALSNSLFINSATKLTDYFPAAKGSRRVFLAMREYLKRAESFFIRPLIGNEFFLDLKEKLADDNLTISSEENEALELLRNALAHRAFSMAIPYLNLNADFRLISETDGVRNEDPATRGKLDGMKVDCDNNAIIFSNKLKKYIDGVASLTKLTPYFNSDTYKASFVQKTYYRTPIDPKQPFVSL